MKHNNYNLYFAIAIIFFTLFIFWPLRQKKQLEGIVASPFINVESDKIIFLHDMEINETAFLIVQITKEKKKVCIVPADAEQMPFWDGIHIQYGTG